MARSTTRVKYLVCRKGFYYVRIDLPADLISIFGQRSLARALDTKDEDEAIAKMGAVVREFKDQIDAAGRGEWPPIDASQIQQWYFWHLTARFRIRSGDILTSVTTWIEEDQIKLCSQAVRERLIRECELFYAERLAQRQGWRDEQERSEDPEAPLKDEASLMAPDVLPVVALPSQPTASQAISADALYEKWKADSTAGLKSKVKFRTYFGRVLDYMALDWNSPIDLIEGPRVVAFKDHLIEKGMNRATIDNHLVVIKALLNYAVDNQHLEKNPANRVTVKLAKRDSRKNRRDYTAEELRHVLTLAKESTDPVVKWLTWLAAFNGARIEELAAAHRRDCCQVDGIWCFKIWLENRVDDNASLKNEGSVRVVPISQHVIDAGFLAYVEGLPDGQLFPSLRFNKYGKTSASDKMSKFLRKVCKIADTRLVFHSHRHTLKTRARAAGIPEEFHNAITGHVEGRGVAFLNDKGNEIARGYGEYPAAVLAREIAKLPNPLA